MADRAVAVTQVAGRRDRREFVRLPFRLYRGDPCWVPPLISQQTAFLDPGRNPFFEHGDAALWLARRGDRAVGRISSHVDHLANHVHDERAASFGFFEAEDEVAGAALLARAAGWAKARGAGLLRGPLSFTTNHECGLLLVSDGGPPPVLLPHSSPTYPPILERFGMLPAQDLLSFRLRRSDVAGDPGRLPARLIALSERLARRGRIEVRGGDPRRYEEEFRRGFEIFNRAWSGNWGFVPATERELAWFARELRPIVDRRLSLFAELDGAPVGFVLTAIDANQVLARMGGRLLPFGWLTALRVRRRVTGARVLLFGVLPEHRGRGIEAALFLELLRRTLAAGLDHLDLAWILESNRSALDPILAVGADYGLRPDRRYRVYELPLTAP